MSLKDSLQAVPLRELGDMDIPRERPVPVGGTDLPENSQHSALQDICDAYA